MTERQRYEQALARLRHEARPPARQFSLYLPPVLRARMEAEAERTGAALSKIVRAALEACLPEG